MNENTVLPPGPKDAITDVPGIRVGHWTDRRGGTGCTVILCEDSVAGAVDTRGGAPGTRETDVLSGPNLVRKAHAVVLCGGSAFGLAATDGVMRYLAERGIGFPTTARNVPIVSGAVLYDLPTGRPDAYPGPDAGYRAAARATAGRVEQGTVGAGTGATVGKLLGHEWATKGGIGTASVVGPRGIIVGAIVANNASGNVLDPATGRVAAGVRQEGGGWVSLAETIARRTEQLDLQLQNTVLVCVATNASLDHHQLQRVAIQSHDGIARAVLPAHTFGDGDVAFAVAMGKLEVRPYDALTVGVLAVQAVETALVRSVCAATGLHGVPSAAEWLRDGSTLRG